MSDTINQVRLQVLPAPSGWRLDCDLPVEANYFRSGGRAEQAARDLAIRLSGLGHDVRVEIHDRQMQIVATQIYFASEDAPPLGAREPESANGVSAASDDIRGD